MFTIKRPPLPIEPAVDIINKQPQAPSPEPQAPSPEPLAPSPELGAGDNDAGSAIMNGNLMPPGVDYSFPGALLYYDKEEDAQYVSCTVTLIAPDWVLTAAHCIWDAFDTFNIVTGLTDQLSTTFFMVAIGGRDGLQPETFHISRVTQVLPGLFGQELNDARLYSARAQRSF
jgi:hypothetical protein